jgi:hypothetical protein
MASPMLSTDNCAICFEMLRGEGTFDLDDSEGLVLVNVCAWCRWWETRQLILRAGKLAEGSGTVNSRRFH